MFRQKCRDEKKAYVIIYGYVSLVFLLNSKIQFLAIVFVLGVNTSLQSQGNSHRQIKLPHKKQFAMKLYTFCQRHHRKAKGEEALNIKFCNNSHIYGSILHRFCRMNWKFMSNIWRTYNFMIKMWHQWLWFFAIFFRRFVVFACRSSSFSKKTAHDLWPFNRRFY